MRRSLVVLALLATVAGCGSQSDRYTQEPQADGPAANAASAEVASDSASPEERAAAGPNIGPTAAPGVAFNYRYAFRLPAERVGEVQEQHAAMCEQLGPERCRITGLQYEVVSERDIRARLNLGLEPSIARRVGREGVAAVLRAEGSLVESEISGTDVGTGIRRAGRSIAQMEEELRRIEQRLAGRLGSGERSDLEYQAQMLRQQIRAGRESRQEAQETLATTPMVFNYGSGNLVPGDAERRPLGRVFEDAADTFLDVATLFLILIVTLGPWALLAALLWWAVRWARRRFGKAPVEPRQSE
jgi:hypothetical protein